MEEKKEEKEVGNRYRGSTQVPHRQSSKIRQMIYEGAYHINALRTTHVKTPDLPFFFVDPLTHSGLAGTGSRGLTIGKCIVPSDYY